MLKQIKKLYDLGFAVHLLHPKSKVPLKSGWTSGPREKWEQLEKDYKPDMNVGVRLGLASQVNGGYLAVIDIDVKSPDPKHKREAYEKLESIFRKGTFESARKVKTGRGNGSMHVYYRTMVPAVTRRIAQSSEMVKIKMDMATKPSNSERSKLTKEELAAGIRIRAAWEIAIMGNGSQVVLPPSIHPDTNRRYEWVGAPSAYAFELPLCDFTQIEKEKTKEKEIQEKGVIPLRFTPEPVDLVSSALTDKVVDLITTGKDCEDRSAGLFIAAMAMVRAKFTDNQITSILTDKTYFLGEAAYDHAKTTNRERAVLWIQKYTIEKARREIEAKYQFEAEVQIGGTLTDEEEELQAIELLEPEDWRLNIERTGPAGDERPKQTVKNVVYILRGELGEDLFTKNEFSGLQHYTRATPWGAKKGDEIIDEHVTRIQHWLSHKYRFEPAIDKINAAITVIAAENSFHPVKNYLERIEWDGTERLDTWLKRYANATAAEPYLSAISRKTLVAMVARVYQPGCKFDTVLILEGPQGIGKSTMVRILAGEWFSDAHINVSDKDGVLSMRGTWIVELGELSGMRRADAEAFKEFTSRGFDRIRVPYGRRTENFPRQCIFIGTTNSDEYLKDVTGNRRFWPVKVSDYDLEAFARDRDQLLAEAKWVYDNLGEKIYLNKEEDKVAREEQSTRMIRDNCIDELLDFIERNKTKSVEERFNFDKFRLFDLFEHGGPFALWRNGVMEQKRVADALKQLGYFSKTARGNNGVTKKYWFKKEE